MTKVDASEAAPEHRFWRQLDLVDPEKLANLPIHIIGCGGIGSAVALFAAKMGAHTLTLWDDDNFEIHNLPNQMCRVQDIEKKKVEAVADIIEQFEDIEVELVKERFNGDVEPNSVVIVAVDSMASRKEIWQMLRKAPIQCIIDGRMGLTEFNVYSVSPEIRTSLNYYEKTLWDDDEVAEVPCTAKSTIFTAGSIASIICGHLTKIVKGEPLPCEIHMEALSLHVRVVDHTGKPVMETQLLEEF